VHGKKVWFRTHSLLGIAAGLVLAVVGVTGAFLSFEHHLLRWLNPGVMTLTPRAEGPLPPHELLVRIQAVYPENRIIGLNLSTDPTEAARVGFAISADDQGGRQRRSRGQGGGGRRGEWYYVDPHTGAVLGQARGQEFFRLMTDIHRRLAAGEVGKAITGAATLTLVVLCLSGLYLRWPRKMWDWRIWLTLNPGLKGRSFLWRLHAVSGTWLMFLYLVASLTGLFWSYEWYRNSLYTLTGAQPPNREGTVLDVAVTEPPDLAIVWAAFLREAGRFSSANVSLSEKPTQAIEIRYLSATSSHERAFNQLVLHPVSGAVIRHDRYAERPPGVKLIHSIFVLHSGSFFGLPGLLLMMAASLAMPLFTITGWMLYLDRRAKKRAARTTAAAVVSAAG